METIKYIVKITRLIHNLVGFKSFCITFHLDSVPINPPLNRSKVYENMEGYLIDFKSIFSKKLNYT